MLMKHEIIVGNLYAWDGAGLCIEPDSGCNLWTIRDADDKLLVAESLDGCVVQTIGSHCLTPAQRALKRLEILRGMEKPTEKSHERWKFDMELKNLSAFEAAYNAYGKTNA